MVSKEQLLSAKIMIVDDNHTNVLLLNKMLKSAGYMNIESITDSRQAIQVYENFHPDLVLLDLRMPHMDGFEVMKQLKEIEQDNYMPVLVLTAHQSYETRLRALQAGAPRAR